MSGDFDPIERVAGALLRQLAPAQRRALLRRMARDIRASQAARIGRQEDPEGRRYAARKAKAEERPGAYAVRFLYPKDSPDARLVFMKSWVRQGPLLTGYDIEAGGIRSFFWDRIAKWVPVEATEQNASAGKFRRKGSIRQKAMFRKLRNARNLREGASDREAWIGFTGRAAEVASIHQSGGMDRPSAKARPVRYAERGLIGLTAAERTRALDLLLDTVTAAVGPA